MNKNYIDTNFKVFRETFSNLAKKTNIRDEMENPSIK